MRSILLVAVALSVAFHGSEAGASQKGRERRSVEVLGPSVTVMTVRATPPDAEVSAVIVAGIATDLFFLT